MKTLTTLLSILFCTLLNAQEGVYKSHGKFGFRWNDQVAIPPEYDEYKELGGCDAIYYGWRKGDCWSISKLGAIKTECVYSDLELLDYTEQAEAGELNPEDFVAAHTSNGIAIFNLTSCYDLLLWQEEIPAAKEVSLFAVEWLIYLKVETEKGIQLYSKNEGKLVPVLKQEVDHVEPLKEDISYIANARGYVTKRGGLKGLLIASPQGNLHEVSVPAFKQIKLDKGNLGESFLTLDGDDGVNLFDISAAEITEDYTLVFDEPVSEFIAFPDRQILGYYKQSGKWHAVDNYVSILPWTEVKELPGTFDGLAMKYNGYWYWVEPGKMLDELPFPYVGNERILSRGFESVKELEQAVKSSADYLIGVSSEDCDGIAQTGCDLSTGERKGVILPEFSVLPPVFKALRRLNEGQTYELVLDGKASLFNNGNYTFFNYDSILGNTGYNNALIELWSGNDLIITGTANQIGVEVASVNYWKDSPGFTFRKEGLLGIAFGNVLIEAQFKEVLDLDAFPLKLSLPSGDTALVTQFGRVLTVSHVTEHEGYVHFKYMNGWQFIPKKEKGAKSGLIARAGSYTPFGPEDFKVKWNEMQQASSQLSHAERLYRGSEAVAAHLVIVEAEGSTSLLWWRPENVLKGEQAMDTLASGLERVEVLPSGFVQVFMKGSLRLFYPHAGTSHEDLEVSFNSVEKMNDHLELTLNNGGKALAAFRQVAHNHQKGYLRVSWIQEFGGYGLLYEEDEVSLLFNGSITKLPFVDVRLFDGESSHTTPNRFFAKRSGSWGLVVSKMMFTQGYYVEYLEAMPFKYDLPALKEKMNR